MGGVNSHVRQTGAMGGFQPHTTLYATALVRADRTLRKTVLGRSARRTLGTEYAVALGIAGGLSGSKDNYPRHQRIGTAYVQEKVVFHRSNNGRILGWDSTHPDRLKTGPTAVIGKSTLT